jgi:lipopolysaccharide export system protein LptC
MHGEKESSSTTRMVMVIVNVAILALVGWLTFGNGFSIRFFPKS